MKHSCLALSLISAVVLYSLSADAQTFQYGAQVDPFFNLKESRLTIEPEIYFEFGNDPTVELIALVPGATMEKNIRDNLDFFQERGLTFVSMSVMDGFGTLLVDTPILRDLVHEGFDYDTQLADPEDSESELIADLNELTAQKRFAFYGNIVPLFAAEARSRGLTYDVNIESLAHIISRAEGSGIGGSDEEVAIAGNIQPLDLDQVVTFIEQLHAAITAVDPDATGYIVFEEAFSPEYVSAIYETTQRLGLLHRHAGADSLGTADIWSMYHYSFYPLSPLQVEVYRFLISLGSTPAVAGHDYGAARTQGKIPQLVVGHYTPWPAAPGSSVEDLYDPSRSEEEGGPLSTDIPVDSAGNRVELRTAGLQRNYFLHGLIAEHITDYFFAVDVGPAYEALASLDIVQDVAPRMDQFAYVLQEERPIINVIIDSAVDLGNDRLTAENEISDFNDIMSDVVLLSLDELVFASIQAAGFEPWVTFNAPLQGRPVEAYWIVTAGGAELLGGEENTTEMPPLWTSADELDSTLLNLIEPSITDTPVIISTMAGLPNSGNWARVREIFGIPLGRGGIDGGPAYASANITNDPDYQTSLATNFLTDGDGELLTTETGESRTMNVLPDTIDWEGHQVRLHGLDPSQFGIFANVISPDEVPSGNILLASARNDESDWLVINTPDDTGANVQTSRQRTVYIFRNEAGGKKILINPNIYHVDMLYPLSSILCTITGRPKTMNRPSTAYVASGPTTAVFAIDDTEVDLNLSVPGDEVLFNKFDEAGNWVVLNETRPKSGLFPITIGRHELIVFSDPSAAPDTSVDEWMIFDH